MEEEPRLSMQIVNNEGTGRESQEFYEKIEAPKFVDFTAPEHYRPDDRYWFCSRVGCDLKHEEEIDPEAIYKNFVIRVMAARSPNVRLRKALNRKSPSTNIKCPLSAPAKPSKSRIPRLAVISSISQKLLDVKGKPKHLPKLDSTPHAKAKQVAAKYLTTPRNKKCLKNANSFRSVQNSKPPSVDVPKNRMVVKALVFNSPKKGISVKTSAELRTPLTKICEGMKRLEITSQRKRVLGYSSKPAKEIRRDAEKSLAMLPTGRQRSTLKVKGRLKSSSNRQNFNNQEAKSLRSMQGKGRGNLSKHRSSVSKKMAENDSSDMVIDVKSKFESSKVGEQNEDVHRAAMEMSEKIESADSTQKEAISSSAALPSTKNLDDSRWTESSAENSDAMLSDELGGKMNAQSHSEEKDWVLNVEDGRCTGENEQENKTISSSEQRGSSVCHPTANQTSEWLANDGGGMNSDDKENASVFAENGNIDRNNHCRRKILGRQETSENATKVGLKVNKNVKGLTSTGTSAQTIKYRKPKPTNPKPFRLRTDERGILKEANLERKIHFLSPQIDNATASRFPCGNSQRRHDSQRKEKSFGQMKCNKDAHEESEKELEKIIQGDGHQQKCQVKAGSGMATPQRRSVSAQRKSTFVTGSGMATPQRHSVSAQRKHTSATSQLENDKDDVIQPEKSMRKTKSPSLQRRLDGTQGVASTKKAMADAQKLGLIKEISRPKEAVKLSDCCATPAAKARAISLAASRSKGKRPATIPKEPNFHNIHVPKSCTRNMA